jgi:hypothetical protein
MLSNVIGNKVGIYCGNYEEALSFYNLCKENKELNLYSLTLDDINNHLVMFKHIVFHISPSLILEHGHHRFYNFNNFKIMKLNQI